MNRVRIALAIILAFAMSLAAAAQTATPPAHQGNMGDKPRHDFNTPPTPEERLNHMARVLNLTADQKNKIKPILDNEASQLQDLRKNTSLSPADRHTKLSDIHQNTVDQIRAVLTPEQQARLGAMRQMRGGRGMRRGQGMGQGEGTGQGEQPQKPPQN